MVMRQSGRLFPKTKPTQIRKNMATIARLFTVSERQKNLESPMLAISSHERGKWLR